MPDSHTAQASATGRRRLRLDYYLLVTLAAATLLLLIQLAYISLPLSGYHGYNESFYFTHGVADAGRGMLAPILNPIDLNNPFVYPTLLAWMLRVFGQTVVVGRLVSTVASFASVLLTFLIGRRLFNPAIGLLSAVVLAVAPGMALAARSIQIDSLMVALELAALAAYLRAVSKEEPRWCIAAGALFGAGMLTKLPVVLLVVALALWQTWRGGGMRWVRLRSTWLTAATAAAVSLPWYVYRYVASPEFEAAQSGIASTGGWNGFGYLWTKVLVEQFWMLSPIFAVLAVAGLVVMASKRTDADKLVLSVIVVHMAVFLFYNFHSYYYLPLLPFAAMSAARLAWTFGSRASRRLAVTALLLAVLILPFTVQAVAAKKWSMLRIDRVPTMLQSASLLPADTTIALWSVLEGQQGPAWSYYLEQRGYSRPQVFEQIPTEGGVPPGNRLAAISGGLASPVPGFKELGGVPLELRAPVLFGFAIRTSPGGFNFFAPGPVSVKRVGSVWEFGTELRTRQDGVNRLYEVTP